MEQSKIDETVHLVQRYIAGRRSQDVANSQVQMEEDLDQGGIGLGEDEDDDIYDDDYELEDEDVDEDLDQDGEANAGVASQGTTTKARRFRSKAWREFVPVYADGEVTHGKCKHCNDVISAKRGHGTSGLRSHLGRCKDRTAVFGALNQINATLMTPDGVSRGMWKWDPDVSRKELVRMVVLHELPLSIVEYDGFRKFVSSLNPSFKMISRRTLKNDIMKSFCEQKEDLKEVFRAATSRISLAMDMWTSNQTIGYMVITAHFINDSWKLEKRIIRFNALETPHTGLAMFNMVVKCICELNIEDKLCAITLDNASNNGRMVQMLRENLVEKNMLHANGKLFHQRCAAHILNLVCQARITILDPIIDNIRESIKYIKVNPSRKEKFLDIAIKQLGISFEGSLLLDVATRWNSTFKMVVLALMYRRAFEALEKQDPQYIYAPSAEEWSQAAAVCRLLEVFFVATNAISATKYPTANLYFQQMWQVKEALDREDRKKNSPFSAVIAPMKKKLDKYWKMSWLALSIPVILDPRFKFDYLEFRYPEIFGSSAESKLAKVKKQFEELFQEYAHLNLPNSTQQGVDHTDMDMESNDPLSDWDQHLKLRASSTIVGSSELGAYMSKPHLTRTDKFDILSWWKTNSVEYPILASMARDILAIPASSVASESAFSTGRRVISDFRSRLAPDTTEALICPEDWYRLTCTTKLSTSSVYDLLDEEGFTLIG